MAKSRAKSKRKKGKLARIAKKRLAVLILLLILTVIVGDALSHYYRTAPKAVVVNPIASGTAQNVPGKVLTKTAPVVFSKDEVEAISRQNYTTYTPTPKYEVSKTVVTYRSYDTDGTPLTIHARIYQPVGLTNAPIFGFAPGTTGLASACAPSLEMPAKIDLGNYESHMVTYAGQGYATVVTDYAGFLDPTRTMQPYMVGPLEGRAVLDSVRALINLDSRTKTLNTKEIFLAGYSQGGHAALWANQIARSYAPELSIKGVIGSSGAVISVDETLEDVTQGSTLSWFGPYVLVSYTNYYHDTYPLADILLPKWVPTLTSDVLGHCINSDIAFWGANPNNVYTPQFIQALKTHTLDTAYPQLEKRMQQNNAVTVATSTPILLNGGTKDNVILPQQEANAITTICRNNPRARAHLHEYVNATHYNTMVLSFTDTLAWMKQIRDGGTPPTDCGGDGA
jgi:pimeloyl-ACP methyl ester carboxylesterase